MVNHVLAGTRFFSAKRKLLRSIGNRTAFLRTISIGDGSVIAACACVPNDVPADTVAAGVPAKVVKELKKLVTDTQDK